MPISQATILAIYGDLCDLCEKIETLSFQAHQPDLFSTPSERRAAVYKHVRELNLAAKAIQRDALAHMMADQPDLDANPITGRIDE